MNNRLMCMIFSGMLIFPALASAQLLDSKPIKPEPKGQKRLEAPTEALHNILKTLNPDGADTRGGLSPPRSDEKASSTFRPIGMLKTSYSDKAVYRHVERGVMAVRPTGTQKQLAPAVVGKSLHQQTLDYLKSNVAIFGLENPELELSLQRLITDDRQHRHLRFQQQRNLIPVWGRELIAHFDQAGNLQWIQCLLESSSELATMPQTTITEQASIETAEAQLRSDGVPFSLTAKQAALMDYSGPTVKQYYWQKTPLSFLDLVWRVEVRPNVRDFYRFFVRCADGEILEYYNATASDAAVTEATNLLGESVQINTFDVGDNFVMVDGSRQMFQPGQSNSQILEDPQGAITTLDLRNRDLTPNVNIFHFSSPDNTFSDATAVSAHDYTGITYQYFLDTHNFNSYDGNGTSIFSIVHATQGGQPMDNAFWNGRTLVFGDGDVAFDPLSKADDIVAHELTHGVIDNTANLEYRFQSGALNESFADVFAVFVDTDDFQIGEDAARTAVFPSGALRDMSDPNNGGDGLDDPGWQPATMDEFAILTIAQDNGGVHVNSGIPNFACFKIISAIGREKAEQIYFRALSQFLFTQSNFFDARLALSRAAGEIFGEDSEEQNAVKTAFDEVGITEGGSGGTEPREENPVIPGDEFLLFMKEEASSANNRLHRVPADNLQGTAEKLSTTAINSFSGRSFAVDTFGRVIYFIDSGFKLKRMDIDGSNEEFVDVSETWGTVAISPSGNRLALTRFERENKIFIVDIENNDTWELELKHPTTAQGILDDIVDFADVMVWIDDHFLAYDARNTFQSPSGGGTISFWDVNIVDTDSGQILPILPTQLAGASVVNPTVARRNSNILCVEVIGFFSTVLGIDLSTGQSGPIVDFLPNLAYPIYSPDDEFLYYQEETSNGDFEVKRVPVSEDKISAAGDPETLFNKSKFPQPLVVGDPLPYISFPEAASSGSEALTTAEIPVELSFEPTERASIQFTVSAVTATEGEDFTQSDVVVTFEAGQTEAVLPVNIIDDAITENKELIKVTLTEPSGILLGGQINHDYAIIDNEIYENIRRHLLDQITLEGKAAEDADANGDGEINVADIIYLIDKLELER